MICPTPSTHRRISARMSAALDSLSVTQRQALYLSVVEHRSMSAVAHALGLPRDTAERIAAAARTKLYQEVAR
jgi:DNA-directed RNA polymerase specialized sigma24 family protein